MLNFPLKATDQQAFLDAAELAGLDLSAWLQKRLMAAAQ
jgi:hypothetical protein